MLASNELVQNFSQKSATCQLLGPQHSMTQRWVAAGATMIAAASAVNAAGRPAALCDDGVGGAGKGFNGVIVGAAAAAAASAAAWLAMRPSAPVPTVDTEGWKKKWEIGQTNFHLLGVHPALTAHGARLLDGLCGYVCLCLCLLLRRCLCLCLYLHSWLWLYICLRLCLCLRGTVFVSLCAYV